MPLIWKNANMLALLTQNCGMSGRFGSLGRLWPVQGLTYGHLRVVFEQLGWEDRIPAEMRDDEPVPDDHTFFRLLGYDAQEAIDASEYEDAEHVFDLNDPDPPQELLERFDVVFNNGTMEHIFNVPNVLANMTRMVRPGGHLIHALPVNNHMDHGYYQFSPSLMFDYCSANGLRIRHSVLMRYEDKKLETPMVPWQGKGFYNPYELPTPTYYDGKLDGAVYALWFVAQRTESSTWDRIPQQGIWRTAWQHAAA